MGIIRVSLIMTINFEHIQQLEEYAVHSGLEPVCKPLQNHEPFTTAQFFLIVSNPHPQGLRLFQNGFSLKQFVNFSNRSVVNGFIVQALDLPRNILFISNVIKNSQKQCHASFSLHSPQLESLPNLSRDSSSFP